MRAVLISLLIALAVAAACGVFYWRWSQAKQRSNEADEPVRRVIASLDEFTTAMCACRDKECADRIHAQLTKWGDETKRTGAAGKQRPDPELTAELDRLTSRYTDCMTALLVGKTPPPPSDATRVTAAALFADYRSNEVAADRKYKGKTLLVSGVIRRVQAARGSQGHIVILKADDFNDVNCVYSADGDIARLERARSGQTTIVRGVGNGAVAGEPVLNPCVFE